MNLINKTYLSLGVFGFTLILLSDMGFYNYFQDHINILFYGVIEDDTTALIETLSKNYPLELIAVVFIAFFILSARIIFKQFPKIQKKGSFIRGGFIKYCFISLITLTLLLGGIRGGYSELVISPKYSDFSDIEFINQASLNGVITLENAIKLRATRTNKHF